MQSTSSQLAFMVLTKEMSTSLVRRWKSGDRVELDLPMPVRRIYASEDVEYDLGRVALMRGPLVYCLEGVDHDFRVLRMVLPKKGKIDAEYREDLLNGVTVLKGKGIAEGDRSVEFVAVPYYAWQNRGIDEMTVWMIEDPNDLECLDLSSFLSVRYGVSLYWEHLWSCLCYWLWRSWLI